MSMVTEKWTLPSKRTVDADQKKKKTKQRCRPSNEVATCRTSLSIKAEIFFIYFLSPFNSAFQHFQPLFGHGWPGTPCPRSLTVSLRSDCNDWIPLIVNADGKNGKKSIFLTLPRRLLESDTGLRFKKRENNIFVTFYLQNLISFRFQETRKVNNNSLN